MGVLKMRGLYTSYNESKNGPFQEALDISCNEYLIWRHPVPVKKNLKYPTKIIVRISGKEKYYKGDLLLVKEMVAFNPEIFFKDRKHRPSKWTESNEGFKSVFFISNLTEVGEPEEIKGMAPPQGIRYVDITD
jgi:hypothetical protein